MENLIKVKNELPKGKTATRNYKYEIICFNRLGKEIRISPKANVSINKPGFKTEFFCETVNVVIGIGKDHTADLIMSKAAWFELLNGAEIHITTTKEFNSKYLFKMKEDE
jgi:hypothetical protein